MPLNNRTKPIFKKILAEWTGFMLYMIEECDDKIVQLLMVGRYENIGLKHS